jgi:hypothetical protein
MIVSDEGQRAHPRSAAMRGEQGKHGIRATRADWMIVVAGFGYLGLSRAGGAGKIAA